MMRTQQNKRCPLQGECERKCSFVGRELECDYYSANARGALVIADQEELRRKREREREEAIFEALMAEMADEDLDADGGRDIETITGDILEAKRVGGEAILTIGRCLNEAKEVLPHGEWLPWLTEKVEFSERTAQNFMRLSREWSNPQTLADLGASKALALLALPAEEREQFMAENHAVDGGEKTVIDMSARELDKAIRERKEALAAAEEARANAKAAEDARAKMEANMTMLKGLLESAKAETASATEEAVKLARELEDLKAKPVEVSVMQVDQEALDKARAEAVAGMQDKLDKAAAARKKAEEKRKAAEDALAEAKAKLEAAQSQDRKAVIAGDKDLATFELLFSQAQEQINKLHGMLLKVKGRGDTDLSGKLQKALLALSDLTRRCAE